MKKKRLKLPKGGCRYHQVWRVVDGAVRDALLQHPNYLTGEGKRGQTARFSIVKRVTGAIMGYSEQSERGRSVTMSGG